MARQSCICPNSPIILNSVVLLISAFALSISATTTFQNQSQLKLVHVIFTHKLHAPLEANNTKYGFPKKLDYKYFLENTYDMVNESKMEMYNFGVYLRQRYDDYLGDIYYPEVLRMRTSEYVLSMIAGLLVNAGMWPPAPSQKWKDDLDWQPIPSEYEQLDKDTLFLGTLCPHFLAEEDNLLKNNKFINNAVSSHGTFFDYVSFHYGQTIDRPSQISMLYSSLETIANLPNATLPSWAEGIFPYGEMMNVSLLAYDLLSRSVSQKQLNGGPFLKRIIDDSAKVETANNTLESSNNSREFKISMYSGEERNLIGVMQAMNLWWSPHIPESGASIIFELRYDEYTKVHGFEIFYYTGVEDNETIALTVPGCDKFCSLNDFNRIVAESLPTDEYRLCHAELLIEKEDDVNSSVRNQYFFLSHIIMPIFALLLSSKY